MRQNSLLTDRKSNKKTLSILTPSYSAPCSKGALETISRILQPYNICIGHKPTTPLRHLLTNVKDNERNDRQEAV